MSDLAALQLSAQRLVQMPAFPGNTPAEQLQNAFVAARNAVFKYAKPGDVLNLDQANLALESISAQMDRNGDDIRRQLDAGQDLWESIGITLKPDDARQFVLAQYSLACSGVGAIITGYAQKSMEAGNISRDEYQMAVDSKLTAFGYIVKMEQDGYLGKFLLPEQEAQRVMMAAGAPKSEFPLIQRLVVGTKASAVYTEPKGLGTVGAAAIAFMYTPAGIVIASAIAVALLAYVFFSIWAKRKEILIAASIMEQQCLDASKYGYKDVMIRCGEYASGLHDKGALDQVLGAGGTKSIINYVMIGVAVYVGILILPQILSSINASQEVMAAHRTRKALAETTS